MSQETIIEKKELAEKLGKKTRFFKNLIQELVSTITGDEYFYLVELESENSSELIPYCSELLNKYELVGTKPHQKSAAVKIYTDREVIHFSRSLNKKLGGGGYISIAGLLKILTPEEYKKLKELNSNVSPQLTSYYDELLYKYRLCSLSNNLTHDERRKLMTD